MFCLIRQLMPGNIGFGKIKVIYCIVFKPGRQIKKTRKLIT